ncbi:MAG: triose-phosphate isomerase [Spirochaetaceae bacterium]
MRRPYIAGNWKMHKTRKEAVETAKAIAEGMGDTHRKVMIAPPFTALADLGTQLEGTSILLGAQNMSCEEEGAHTGEVSVHMLKDCGVQVVILGHSERRLVYGESDEFINKKVHLALEKGMEVILCVGETLEQREAGVAEKVVEEQMRGSLAGVGEKDLKEVVIAYEPVWAIGTGKTATPEDADAMHGAIRGLLKAMYSRNAAEDMVIQYGGSVKPKNIDSLMAKENIDGALVGGASLTAENFLPIIRYNN